MLTVALPVDGCRSICVAGEWQAEEEEEEAEEEEEEEEKEEEEEDQEEEEEEQEEEEEEEETEDQSQEKYNTNSEEENAQKDITVTFKNTPRITIRREEAGFGQATERPQQACQLPREEARV